MVAKSRKRKTEEAGAAQPASSPMPNWTISVRDFGRVASAEIEMAPMVVLVGKNNTGKSYIASLLWAMMNADDILLSSGLRTHRKLKSWTTLSESLKTLAKEANRTGVAQGSSINDQLLEKSLAYLNEAINLQKKNIFEKLFAHELDVGSVRITANLALENSFQITALPRRDEGAMWSSRGGYSYELSDDIDQDGMFWATKAMINLITIGRPFRIERKASVYIPAARTGLMIAYKPIVAGAFEAFGSGEDKQRTRLPLPVVRFLKCFTDLQTNFPSSLTPIVAALENELIQGRVDASKDPVPSFWYEPDLLKTQLPLHATSSMITELAPFLLLLKNGFSENGLVFEEPEAHLHISAQRTLARLLVRIMNAGTRVVITTHSDTFIQQLNNLMQLHTHPKREQLMKQFGYTAEDLLDPAMVKGYEFNPIKNGKTVVNPTKMNPGGLVVPSLNETLIGLAKELRALQSD